MEHYSVNIEGQEFYFKAAGSGPVLILLHPSPSSSDIFIPMMQQLSNDFMVIALDTPGYGRSQPLKIDFKSMSDYTSILKKFFSQLGMKKFSIYGSATGAQLGIRYALENPAQIVHLYLDNTAHFSKEDKVDFLKDYFPDLSPSLDGAHLSKTWEIVKNLFQYFPWCKKEPAYKLKVPMPPLSILHMMVKDYLVAGKNYDMAYRAAFEHERAEFVQQLSVPTSIFFWEGSILKPYTQRLIDHPLPPNVLVTNIPADRIERQKKMHDEMLIHSSNALRGPSITFPPYDMNESMKDFSTYPKIEFDDGGAYLINAWNYLRNRGEFDDLNQLQKDFLEWMQAL